MLVQGMACFQLSSSDLLSHRAVIIVERCFGQLLRCFGQNMFDFLHIATLCNLVSVDTCCAGISTIFIFVRHNTILRLT